MDDEELNQDGLFRFTDGLKNRPEGFFAVDQQPDLVVGQRRHVAQLGHCTQRRIGIRSTRGHGFFHPWPPVEAADRDPHFLVGLATRFDVRVE